LIVEDEFIVTEYAKVFSGTRRTKDAEIFFANNVEQCIELLEKEKPTLMI